MHTLWVADTVPVGRLAIGAKIVASAYRPNPGARWIVTQFTLG